MNFDRWPDFLRVDMSFLKSNPTTLLLLSSKIWHKTWSNFSESLGWPWKLFKSTMKAYYSDAICRIDGISFCPKLKTGRHSTSSPIYYYPRSFSKLSLKSILLSRNLNSMWSGSLKNFSTGLDRGSNLKFWSKELWSGKSSSKTREFSISHYWYKPKLYLKEIALAMCSLLFEARRLQSFLRLLWLLSINSMVKNRGLVPSKYSYKFLNIFKLFFDGIFSFLVDSIILF